MLDVEDDDGSFVERFSVLKQKLEMQFSENRMLEETIAASLRRLTHGG
jgi:hypothetical protein